MTCVLTVTGCVRARPRASGSGSGCTGRRTRATPGRCGRRGAEMTILHGDALTMLRTLPASSVQTCVTSPPYFNHRDYGHPDQIGLEPTPESYIARLVEVFAEVRRVLRDDGTLWVVIGDSYAGGGPHHGETNLGKNGTNKGSRTGVDRLVRSSVLDELQSLLKGRPIFCGNAPTIRVTSKRVNVSLTNNRTPQGELIPLLGVQRVTFKKRDDDLGQVLNLLDGPTDARIRIDRPLRGTVRRNATDMEIVLDAADDISVIISELDSDVHSVLSIPGVGSGTGKQADAAFAIEESGEPIAKCVGDVEATGDSFVRDSTGKRLPDVYLVNQAIPLGDALDSGTRDCGDFRVTAASEQHVTFKVGNGGWYLTFTAVGHVYIPDGCGGVRPYSRVYQEAIGNTNEKMAKQELGIPFMLRRALMRDGWICRSTIIWSKPNPMPESVTDRPTKAHEYVFLLSKSARYFYDADAIREPHVRLWGESNGGSLLGSTWHKEAGQATTGGRNNGTSRPSLPNPAGRNRRTVWDIPTQPVTDAHFATFPEALVEPCILAGTSERGQCRTCGAPWVRVVEWERVNEREERRGNARGANLLPGRTTESGLQRIHNTNDQTSQTIVHTTGWQPSCTCGTGEPVPQAVLDPFAGSGTTARVAEKLGRRWVAIELNAAYIDIIRKRTAQRGFASVLYGEESP